LPWHWDPFAREGLPWQSVCLQVCLPRGAFGHSACCFAACGALVPRSHHQSFVVSCLPPQPPAPIAAPCLTHHQILDLVAPFASQGYRLDLAGSDRLQRRLRFQPCDAADSRESLLLDSPAEGCFRLTRSLEIDGALVATLQCEGKEPATLLQSLQSAAAQQQFLRADGYLIVWHRHVRRDGAAALCGAEALLPNLTMTLTAPRAGTGRATVEIRPHAGRLNLPDDLFAVLGRQWSTLQCEGRVWRLTLRLSYGDAAREFERGVRHLQRVLAEPPPHFHQRHRLARWAVSASRSMLLAAWMTLALLVAAAPPLWLGQASVWPLLLSVIPLALLWGSYQFAELPRLRWPRRPRPPQANRWLEPQP
jgi:hypothetical protein